MSEDHGQHQWTLLASARHADERPLARGKPRIVGNLVTQWICHCGETKTVVTASRMVPSLDELAQAGM